MADTTFSTIFLITHGEPSAGNPDELSQYKTSRGENFIAELVKAEFARLPFDGIMYANTPLCLATVLAFITNSENDYLAGRAKKISEEAELYSPRSEDWKRIAGYGNFQTIAGMQEIESKVRAGGGILKENFILSEGERIFRFLEDTAKTLRAGDTLLCITARILLGAVILWLWENRIHPLFRLHKKGFEKWKFPGWMEGFLLLFREGEFEGLIRIDPEELIRKNREERAAVSDISRLFKR